MQIETLPAIIDRATRRLAEAVSSAEVLEAKRVAEAALHYAKITKAANETHAHCIRIISRAEMRMADEIDAGQATGELAAKDISVRGSDTGTYDDLGVSRQRVSEWREIRDAGMAVVDAAIGRELRAARRRKATSLKICAARRGPATTNGTRRNSMSKRHAP